MLECREILRNAFEEGSQRDSLPSADVDQAMLGWDEKPRPELYVEDGLHVTPQGYAVWTALLRPFMGLPTVRTGDGRQQ